MTREEFEAVRANMETSEAVDIVPEEDLIPLDLTEEEILDLACVRRQKDTAK